MKSHDPVYIDPPRDLSQLEYNLLRQLFRSDFQGKPELLKQLDCIKVNVECSSCHSIEFTTEVPGLPVAEVKRRIPIEAVGVDNDQVRIHFLLHIIDGFIHELEIFKEDGSDIYQMPKPEILEVINYG